MLLLLTLTFLSLTSYATAQGEGDVRLVGGATNTSGRVEIYHNGQWGTVCNRQFGIRDTTVVCNQLGITGLRPAVWRSAPAGSGPILLDDLGCSGTEATLSECRHQPWGQHECDHRDDAGVECDAQSFADELRLTGGTERSGRLEVNYGGTWGPVCAVQFDVDDAHVACRTLGFDSHVGNVTVIYEPGTGEALLANVACSGDEFLLSECTYTGPFDADRYCGSSGAHVALNCLEEGDVRLADGATNTSGRIEIYYNGQWGTVCNTLFESKDATVVCNQLGLAGLRPRVWPDVPDGSGPTLLYDLGCNGTEETVRECQYLPWGRIPCPDAGVECDTQSFVNELRLTGGTDRSGRLEVNYAGTWGTVCHGQITDATAEVACRTLGFNRTGAHRTSLDQDRAGAEPLLAYVRCRGDEQTWSECNYTGPFDVKKHCPRYGPHLGITCLGDTPLAVGNVTARLVGGFGMSGRLELSVDGVWGTVCYHGFDDNAAKVACKMLGYPTEHAMEYWISPYRPDNIPIVTIWLDNVRCNGSEDSIASCRHSEWTKHKCQHSLDISVWCPANLPGIRLVGSSWPLRGRVEVEVGSIWGTVCDDGWTYNNTRVVCRALNLPFENARRTDVSDFDQSGGYKWLDDVVCEGDEQSLFDCRHKRVGVSDCVHSEDVAVICE